MALHLHHPHHLPCRKYVDDAIFVVIIIDDSSCLLLPNNTYLLHHLRPITQNIPYPKS